MKALARHSSKQQGSIAFVLIVLIAVMAMFLVLNARTLHTFKQELKLLDLKQRQHWTNAPALSVAPAR